MLSEGYEIRIKAAGITLHDFSYWTAFDPDLDQSFVKAHVSPRLGEAMPCDIVDLVMQTANADICVVRLHDQKICVWRDLQSRFESAS